MKTDFVYGNRRQRVYPITDDEIEIMLASISPACRRIAKRIRAETNFGDDEADSATLHVIGGKDYDPA